MRFVYSFMIYDEFKFVKERMSEDESKALGIYSPAVAISNPGA